MLVLKNNVHIRSAGISYDRPTYIQHTKNNTANSTITLTKPTTETINNNDLLIIIVMNDNSSATAQWDNSTFKPTGFTFIKTGGDGTSDSHFGIFYRIVDGSEGATVAVSAQSNSDYVGFYIHIAGANDTTPIVNQGTVTVSIGTPTTAVGVTGNADDLGIVMSAYDGADGSPFSTSSGSWVWKDNITNGAAATGVLGGFGLLEYASVNASNCQVDAANTDGHVVFQLRIVK